VTLLWLIVITSKAGRLGIRYQLRFVPMRVTHTNRVFCSCDIGKNLWELIDENNDEMEQMEWDGDNGIGNMVGMYIKHADKAFCDYFETIDNCMKQARKARDASNDIVTPRRCELRKRVKRNYQRRYQPQ
jgi:hypothetical protein